MPQTTCHDAFAEAQLKRRPYPLEAGAYKLREARHRLLRMMNTVDAIGEYLCKPGSGRSGSSLGPCCTTDDKAVWLKCVPDQVAEMLGYDILPAIAALTADGASPTDVAAELASAQARTDELLKDCEAHRVHLNERIKVEYAAIKSGQSKLYTLLIDADHISQYGLKLTEKNNS
jgi:hypothetical protein